MVQLPNNHTLNPSQIEWLSNHMPHFKEMFLTNAAVRKDEALYKQGYVHHRNRTFASDRGISIQNVIDHQRSAVTRLPLFERIATTK